MERIPLPNETAREKRPIHVETRLDAFPNQRFAFRLDWNPQLGCDDGGKWTIEIEHLDRDLRVTRSTATPYRPYPYLPWVVFVFVDRSNKQMAVTPSNLGDEMGLYVLPGPAGADPDGGAE